MRCLLLSILMAGCVGNPRLADKRAVIVVEGSLQAPARHGLDNLERALVERGFTVERVPSLRAVSADLIVIAGLAAQPIAADPLRKKGFKPPKGPRRWRWFEASTRGRRCSCCADRTAGD